MSPTPESLLDIPERYEDVTAEWLTQALRAGGVLGDQEINSFRVEPIGADQSRTSSLARIAVKYDLRAEGLPDSIFAKFVSRIPGNRRLANQFDFFRAEIAVYQNLGDAIPMNLPRMYFGAAKEGSDVAVLLLEEIEAISKAGLFLDKRMLTESEAKLALSELSKLHAKWWEDPVLDGFTWLADVDSDSRMFLYDSYDEAWRKIKDVLEPALSITEVRICGGFSSYLPTLISDLKRMPMTLCHGDFHQGNLLWDKLGEPRTVWALDWQLPHTGPAVIDVAWFLGIGVAKADVHLVQQKYLPDYHAALLGQGAANYEYDRFLSDYKYGVLDGLIRFIAILAKLDFAREDSVEFARVVVGNLAAAAVDAGCAELIS